MNGEVAELASGMVMADGSVSALATTYEEPAGEPQGVSAPPPPRKFRVDWSVMASRSTLADGLRVGALTQGESDVLDLVPALSVSRVEYTARTSAMKDWIGVELGACGSLGKRPLIMLNDETEDPRDSDNLGYVHMLRDWRAEVQEAFPWADVSFYGPWEATANKMQATSQRYRIDHQRTNNALAGLFSGAPRFCPSMYQPTDADAGVVAFNLREFQRLMSLFDRTLGGNGPKTCRPVLSPFVEGEVAAGALSPAAAHDIASMVVRTPRVDGAVVWGWVDYPVVAERWRQVATAFLNHLRLAAGFARIGGTAPWTEPTT